MAILCKKKSLANYAILTILALSNGLYAEDSYHVDDVDYDGFIDAIEFRYGGNSEYVEHSDLTPPHGTPIIIGLTNPVHPAQRFPEIDNAVAIAAGGSDGSDYFLILKGNGRVESWSSIGNQSIEMRLYASDDDWLGTHPNEWEGIVAIEASPFGVFGIDVNHKIHYCAEPWAADAVESIDRIASIATSNDSLIAISTSGKVHTWSDSWTVPDVPPLWQNADSIDAPVQVAAGNRTFWAVSERGDMIGWGDPDNLASMTYNGPEEPIQRVAIGRDWAAGVVWFQDGTTYSWGTANAGGLNGDTITALEVGPSRSFAALDVHGELTGEAYSLLERSLKRAPEDWRYVDISAGTTLLGGILNGTPLEWAVANRLGRNTPDDLNEYDWKNRFNLYLENLPINSLNGIEQAVNLHALHIINCDVQDLSPLATLYQLDELRIEDSPVLYIDAIMGLPLTSVSLDYTFFSELVENPSILPLKGNEALRNLAELRSRGLNVNVDSNVRRDWWQIYDPSLAALIMFDQSYPNNWGLIEAANLTSPTYNGGPNTMQTVSGLRGLEMTQFLDELYLSNSRITDLSPLDQLPNLHVVDLSNNPIADIAPLLSLKNLSEVNLDNTGAAELLAFAPESPIAKEIQRIVSILESRNVTVEIDTNTVRQDWQLHFSDRLAQNIRHELGIESEALSLNDLESLYELRALNELPPIHDLNGLQYAWNLEDIIFRDQAISELTSLQYLHKLTRALLYNVSSNKPENRISDLSPLIGHPSLENLDLRGTDVLNIEALAHMPKLKEVNLGGTFVGELIQNGDPYNNPAQQAAQKEQHALIASGVDVGINNPSQRRTDWWRAFEPALGHEIAHNTTGDPQRLELYDIENIYDLRATEKAIKELSGIELVYQLESIQLRGNRITDITPLANLKNLHSLDLEENPIADITPILDLPALQEVWLDGTFFAELVEWEPTTYPSALSRSFDALNQLRGKDIHVSHNGSNRFDWWVLFDPKLLILVMQAVGTNDHELSLDDLMGLRDLEAYEPAYCIGDLSGVEYAFNLNSLYLRDQNISDISPLYYLPELQQVDLSNENPTQSSANRVSDLSPLINHPALESISLINTDVLNLAPLRTIPRLQSVELHKTFAEELAVHGDGENPVAQKTRSDLYSLPAIYYGNVRRNDWWRIFDPELSKAIIEASNETPGTLTLEAIEGLENLDAQDAGISSINHLSLAYLLETLNLDGNPIFDLGPLSDLKLIEELSLSGLERRQGHPIDLKPLSTLQNLQALDLNDNLLLDIEPLLNITNLQTVNLSDTLVEWEPENPFYWVLKVLESRGVVVTDGSVSYNWNELFDPALAAAILNAVGHTRELTFSDILNLTSLEADEAGIESLEGLQWATNLTSLSLRNNRITDISPLAALTQLTDLDLGVDSLPQGNLFRDISPLGNLWSLQNLNLQGCAAVDYSILQSLPSLQNVNLQNAGIASDEPLITELERHGIHVQTGGSVDLARVLAPSLAAAILYWHGNIDIYTRDLHLENHSVTSLDGISIFQQLETLRLDDNRISDISPLANMPQLREISFKNSGTWVGNSISDISVLATLPVLEYFDLEGNLITNIEPLLHCLSLQWGDIRENFLMAEYADSPDGKIIQALENRGVSIDVSTSRSDWHKIFKDPMLASYFLGADDSQLAGESHLFGPIHDLTGVEKLYKLSYINLEDSYVQDLTPLSNLVHLEYLNLSRPHDITNHRLLTDISPLRNLPKLFDLNLENQGVQDINVLVTLPSLNHVNLAGNYLDLSEGSKTSELIEQLQRQNSFQLDNQRIPFNQFTDPGLERAIRNQLGLGPNELLDANDWDSLTTLDAEGYGIKDISMLNLARNLKELKLSGNNITDFSVLQDLDSLEMLELDNDDGDYPGLRNQLTDLDELTGKALLREISLVGNQVSDLTPLLRMRSLDYLNLDENPLDLRNDSETVRLLTTLTNRGSTVIFDDRYRSGLSHGIAEVKNNPTDHNLYTRNQLRGLALGKPLLEKEDDGEFRLKLNIYESYNLINWYEAQGAYEQNGGQLIWQPDDQSDIVFYQIEAQ